MQPVTYSLLDKHKNSDKFYSDIDHFTTRFLKKSKEEYDELLKRFSYFIVSNEIETPRSSSEYLIEFLSIGVLWNIYHPHAVNLGTLKRKILVHLYSLRQHQEIKDRVDKIRGYLMYRWLTRQNNTRRLPYTNDGFAKLIDWLDSAGDFHEEVRRFQNWQKFFAQLPPLDASSYLAAAARFALFFEKKASVKLAVYTHGVEHFLKHEHASHKNNENYIFTGRKPVEYHLNMVAAEIMNREFKKEFDSKPQKIVLLPTCMRSKSDSECRAMRNGLDIHCSGCDKECRINQLTQKCKSWGAETRLVPHSSQFTKWLKMYQDNDNVALVGVACVLNLLTGGYEMKNLGLASQCVFLDYCGCQKHWHQDGIATDLNEKRLQKFFPEQSLLQKMTNHLYAVK